VFDRPFAGSRFLEYPPRIREATSRRPIDIFSGKPTAFPDRAEILLSSFRYAWIHAWAATKKAATA
jgi:hypothetical protein